MKEIGSEFWEEYRNDETAKSNNVEYLLSGRTALDFIIKDIIVNSSVKTALLPSFCCDSMIKPFLDNSISVSFYDVDSKGIHYQYDNDAEIVLLLDLFGYEIKENQSIARTEKLAGKVVIYDSTHKLNGNLNVEQWADYSFCSYRKWFYCNYAKVTKHNGPLTKREDLLVHKEYVALRNHAAALKRMHIEKRNINKDEFLSKFSDAEALLEESYNGLAGIPKVVPISDIIDKRRENANFLIEHLPKNDNFKLMRSELFHEDTPLFVPVLVNPLDRHVLQKHLSKAGIYCPIHWPRTPMQTKHSDLYDQELSLICDQRYSIKDMKRIVKEINSYYSR